MEMALKHNAHKWLVSFHSSAALATNFSSSIHSHSLLFCFCAANCKSTCYDESLWIHSKFNESKLRRTVNRMHAMTQAHAEREWTEFGRWRLRELAPCHLNSFRIQMDSPPLTWHFIHSRALDLDDDDGDDGDENSSLSSRSNTKYNLLLLTEYCQRCSLKSRFVRKMSSFMKQITSILFALDSFVSCVANSNLRRWKSKYLCGWNITD